MIGEAEDVTLMNLGGGVAIEAFHNELKKVMDNIRDPNTDAKKARRITLQIDFMPLRDRTGMDTSFSVSSKLASVPAVPTGTVFIIRENGELHAISHDSRQEVLPLENVTPIASGQK